MVSKAVHLELVGDLTSQSFLAALDRMILRRNHVENIYSDNGRNFVGASNELDRVYKAWLTKDVIGELALRGITWHFNTPLAPHHGGIWESMVKGFKHHLYTTVGNGTYTFEQLYTILVRIKAILNSRPLVTPTSDPTDLTVITPGHLISGEQIIRPLGPHVDEVPSSDQIAWDKIR